jgi:hypothetical protein
MKKAGLLIINLFIFCSGTRLLRAQNTAPENYAKSSVQALATVKIIAAKFDEERNFQSSVFGSGGNALKHLRRKI